MKISTQLPKGRILIIGGGEAREEKDLDASSNNKEFEHFEILKELLPKKTGKKKIEIVTTASSEPERMEEMYTKAFNSIGDKNIGFIHIANNFDARNPKYVNRVKSAHAVFFAGGSQLRLSTVLGNTPFLEEVFRRYMHDPDFIVGGTSAGAAAMNTVMMYEGESNEALLKETVDISSGLGFLDNCLIDTHFVKRGRFGRLLQAVIMNPMCIGIGLGEDAAFLISSGNIARCLGSGMVVIIDPHDLGHTNIAYVGKDEPIYAENVRVHVLCKDSGYLLKERKFLPDLDAIRKEQKLKPAEKLKKIAVNKKLKRKAKV